MANVHTARILFPEDRTPSPDFDLDITNRTIFDADYEEQHHDQDREQAGQSQQNPTDGRPAYFPFVSASAAEEAKMPRPKGTQGKAWSLPQTLGWDERSYKTVQRELHEIQERLFDQTRSYDAQTADAKERYVEEALQQFPFLGEYPNAWPASEFAWLYLKNTNASGVKNKRREWKY